MPQSTSETSSAATAPEASPRSWPEGVLAVETHGLTKRFGQRTAIDDVDLYVPTGSAFGFLGPNGAAKTTMIRMLLGLTHPSAGTMSLLGRVR
jgi:ABC-2 type transport system ATP-binding protein